MSSWPWDPGSILQRVSKTIQRVPNRWLECSDRECRGTMPVSNDIESSDDYPNPATDMRSWSKTRVSNES